MVKYRDNAQLDPSQMGGSRGGNGGKIALGGGAGLIVLVLALFLGINPGDLMGGTAGPQAEPEGTAAAPYQQCTKGADISRDRECRFVAYTNSIQSYWAGAYDGYQKIQVIPFTGQVSTACGTASSAVGPFYCPGDTTVYLDTGFFDELTSKLGAKGGDAAEAYVFAHEFGHHIQNLTGVMQKVQSQGQQSGPKSGGVRLELQADCYAGVWMNHATKDPNSPIEALTPGRPQPGHRRRGRGRGRPDPGADAGSGQPGELDPRLGRQPAEVAEHRLHHRRPEQVQTFASAL